MLEFRDVDIEIYLGECKASVRSMLDKSGFYQHVYRRNVCATIHHAVQVARRSAVMSREVRPYMVELLHWSEIILELP